MAQQTPRVKPIPDGYHSATPYLIVEGAARAIDFYKRAFNATELMRIPAPNQRIGHAEIKIGDSVIMLADEHPDIQARGPQHYGGSPGARRRGRWPTSFTATARAASPIPSATTGTSRPTRKT